MPVGTPDKLTLAEWLAAADLSLEDSFDAQKANAKHESTYRFKGVAMLVNIHYSNKERAQLWDSFFGRPPPLTYSITVQHLAETGFKQRQVVREYEEDGKFYRSLRVKHGVLFKIQTSGQAGRFEWSAVLSELVLKLGLITLLGTILDVLWIYVLPFLGVDYTGHVFKSLSKQELKPKTD